MQTSLISAMQQITAHDFQATSPGSVSQFIKLVTLRRPGDTALESEWKYDAQ